MQIGDEFQAKLARTALLPTQELIQNALLYHMKRQPSDFNRAIADGAKVGGDMGLGKQEDILFTYCVETKRPYIRAFCLYIYKTDRALCSCGEESDTVYIVFSPPTEPAVWELYLSQMGISASTHLHSGLGLMAEGLTNCILKVLHDVRRLRFEERNGASPAAVLEDQHSWGFPVRLTGYGFGGALAQVVASRLQNLGTVFTSLHLTTFGAPSVGRENAAYRLASIRRFAHAQDPVTRLMPPSFGYGHFSKPLQDETKVEINYRGAVPQAAQVCQALSCHTAYLQIDFRDKALMQFYSKMPLAMATMMIEGFPPQSLEDLWAVAYRESWLLTAEGSTPCPWGPIVLGEKQKPGRQYRDRDD